VGYGNHVCNTSLECYTSIKSFASTNIEDKIVKVPELGDFPRLSNVRGFIINRLYKLQSEKKPVTHLYTFTYNDLYYLSMTRFSSFKPVDDIVVEIPQDLYRNFIIID
jgi:hypothetical protein